MFKDPAIVQLIGFMALGISLLVFQVNKRKSMLNLQLAACCLYVIHFTLLGAYTGAAMNVVGGARSYVFITFRNNKYARWLPYLFIAAFTASGLLTWQGMKSVLPILASVGGTTAFWQKNPRTIRLLSLISPPLWLTYNILVGSYAGILSEIFLLGSTLVGIYRFDILVKRSSNKK